MNNKELFEKKIVVLGANGQVASEVLLEIKKSNPEIPLVGVCRNSIGSLYLRHNQIPVVHASLESLEEEKDVSILLKEAEVIVNAIFIRGKPAEIKKRHKKIIEKILFYAGENTKIIHFSSVAIFHRGIYAKEKLYQEKLLIKLAKKYNKKLIILRLGHVLGRNQGNSKQFFEFLKNAEGEIMLPRGGNYEANCISIEYLAEIIKDIFKKDLHNNINIYSAVFNPIVTWSDIFNYLGAIKIAESDITSTNKKSINDFLKILIYKIFGLVRNNRVLYDYGMKVIRHLPFLEEKIYFKHLLSKANEEINALKIPLLSLHFPSPDLSYLLWSSVPGKRYPLTHNIKKEEVLYRPDYHL